MSTVLYEKSNHIGLITINRPEALNALNMELLCELEKIVLSTVKDNEVRVLIITGSGKAFVAGADIASMSTMSKDEAFEFAKIGNRVFSNIENLDIPVIAAVNGFALGGGNELCLSCDIRYASEKAKFGQPEVSLGITPGFGGTQRLSRVVGIGHAQELILTGKTINASRAKEIGLVNEVFSPEELIPNAMQTAEQIAKNAPIAVSYAKKCVGRFTLSSIKQDLDFESRQFSLCFLTADQKMAMKAFVEKLPHEEFSGK